MLANQVTLFDDPVEQTIKDIRSDAQSNRKIAYDVGEKIGGARKDEFALRQSFEEKSTVENLKELEDCSAILAAEMVTKKLLFKNFSLEQEKDRGTDPVVARIKQLLIQRIDSEPATDSEEGRKSYLIAAQHYQKAIEPIRTLDELINFVYSIRRQLMYERPNAFAERKLKEASEKLPHCEKGTPEYDRTMKQYREYKEMTEQIQKASKTPLRILGKKFTNFFTDHKSANNTINNVQKKVNSWDDLLRAKATKTNTGNKPVWERKLPERPDRIGGKESTIQSAEGLMKEFGFRAVEFGHYLNDQVGAEHIFRSSEAFYDLTNILQLQEKAVSLQQTLAMAFGSRGRGSALGHFEPLSKVINLTKERGCLGITAHEWFHAFDNWLFNFSHGFTNGKIGYLSNLGETVGSKLPSPLLDSFQEVMIAITEGSCISYIENTNQDGHSWRISSSLQCWYEQYNGDLLKIMKRKKALLDSSIERRMELCSYLNVEQEKGKLQRKNEKELRKYAQALAWYHEQQTGKRIKEIPIPMDHSQFVESSIQLDRGKKGKYWSSPVEMVARAFEGYIEDKLISLGRKNDYLVCGTKDKSAFPIGEERADINVQFDKFFSLFIEENLL